MCEACMTAFLTHQGIPQPLEHSRQRLTSDISGQFHAALETSINSSLT